MADHEHRYVLSSSRCIECGEPLGETDADGFLPQQTTRAFICEGGPRDGQMLAAGKATNRVYLIADDGGADHIYDLNRGQPGGGRKWIYVGRGSPNTQTAGHE